MVMPESNKWNDELQWPQMEAAIEEHKALDELQVKIDEKKAIVKAEKERLLFTTAAKEINQAETVQATEVRKNVQQQMNKKEFDLKDDKDQKDMYAAAKSTTKANDVLQGRGTQKLMVRESEEENAEWKEIHIEQGVITAIGEDAQEEVVDPKAKGAPAGKKK